MQNIMRWWELSEAARELSAMLNKEITAARVLQLGLDSGLKLAFRFFNPSPAVYGSIVSHGARKAICFPTWYGTREFFLPDSVANGFKAAEYHSENGDNVVAIRGVWDLLMIEDAPSAVEREIQRMTGGSAVHPTIERGIALRSPDGQFAIPQEKSDQRHPHPHHRHNYKLAHDLPMSDGKFVIRADAMEEVIASMQKSRQEPAAAPPIQRRETHQRQILVAITKLGFNPKAHQARMVERA
jgi:hypothetical protein